MGNNQNFVSKVGKRIPEYMKEYLFKKNNRRIKIIILILVIISLYYILQYISSAIHYNCYVIKDDCVPPINLVSESIYRVMVKPPWLNRFEIKPTVYFLEDGQFSFWEGEVNRDIVVIRVPKDGSPVMQWIFEEELPSGIMIRPASGENIKKWFQDNPEY